MGADDGGDGACPLCARSFEPHDSIDARARHVNACLDGVPAGADADCPADAPMTPRSLPRSRSAPAAVQASIRSFFARSPDSDTADTALSTTIPPLPRLLTPPSPSPATLVAMASPITRKRPRRAEPASPATKVAITAADTPTVAVAASDAPTTAAPTANESPARTCPFYKWIPGTAITVDAFNYGRIPGCTAYFLTHFHSDHYGGLSRRFEQGKLYCSPITAALVISQLGVSPMFVCALPLDTTHEIDGGVRVTFIDANHCPGAVLILFELPGGAAYLHTGDFRACPSMLEHSALRPFVAVAPADARDEAPDGPARSPLQLFRAWTASLLPASALPPAWTELVERSASPLLRQTAARAFGDADRRRLKQCAGRPARTLAGVFLDTTYCGADHEFPSQSRVVTHVLDTVRASLAANKRTLFVVGSYQIGKERVFLAIAELLQCRVYADARKRAVLARLGDPHLTALLTDDASSTNVHVVHMGGMSVARLTEYHQAYAQTWSSLVAFRPTGWTFRGSNVEFTVPAVHGNVRVYGLPYSEHSSFLELECFVRSLRPSRVIPTVNVGSAEARARMQAHFREWLQP